MSDWIFSLDHKRVGRLYMLVAVVFLLVGGLEAMAMRVQLARPNLNLISPELYNQLFTMHGTTMIFLVAMPLLTGFGIYLTPLMIGANRMAFPRLGAFTCWLQLAAGLLIYASFVTGGAPDAGWFAYAPLTEKVFSASAGLDYWAAGLLLVTVSSIASAINVVVTVAAYRAPGMTMRRLPFFVWTSFVTSVMIVFALPALGASLMMLLADRQLNGLFFHAERGGAPLIWQHFFWFFGHPEVYIVILPAFGMISEIIPVFSRKPIFGYSAMASATLAVAFLSYGVWAHHMFAVNIGHSVISIFEAASMLIGIPIGLQVFSWIATMMGGSIRFTTAMLFAVAFLIEFTIGGLGGEVFASAPLDWQLTDSFFVVAHIHYVLIGGTIFALLAGTHYWFPKMTGRLMDETLGKWSFWIIVIGFNLTFFVQHLLGIAGMPRRVYTYPDLPGLGAMNLISTVGAGILTLGIFFFVGNLIVSLFFGTEAGDDPWDAWTLEWTTSSPPQEMNFTRVPVVGGRRPLWDVKYPAQTDASVGAAG